MYDSNGNAVALSWLPSDTTMRSISELPGFQALRADPATALGIGNVFRADDGVWALPLGRRLEKPSGEFAGLVGARGLVAYFQDFYRDIRTDPGTKVTLMHSNGALLARYPPAEGSLGKKLRTVDATLAARAAGDSGPFRTRSPVDGVERFAAVRVVPDYPLAVVVSRDVDAALAEWRGQAMGTGARTLAMGLLAVMLLAIVNRQVRRLDAAHESLQASRERFALAVAGSDDGIWDWNSKSGAIFASARARQIYGLPPGPDTTPRDQWFAQVQVHPDDIAPRRAAVEAHVAGKTPLYEFEYRVHHPDGSYRWVRARGLCVRDRNGEPLRMAGSVSDIDARRRAEEERRLSEQALRVSEERFALAVAGSDVGIWDWDFAAGMAFESVRARELQGLPPRPELQRLDDLIDSLRVHPEDAPLRAERIRAHLAGESRAYEVDYRVRHDDGQYRWVRVRALCIRDVAGKPYRMAGSVVDIDAQRRAEEGLRLSEERYAIAMTGSDEAHWVWNVKTDELYSTAQLHRLTGIGDGDMPATRTEWRGRVPMHPDDRERTQRAVDDHLAGLTPRLSVDYRIIEPVTGDVRWIDTRGQCFRDADGQPDRVAGSTFDITERKRAEEALRESEERYQLAVAGSNEGMWDWDMRKETFFFSARAQELLGLDPGESMRSCQEWWGLFRYHPDDEKRVHDALKAYLDGTGASWEVEYRIHHHRSDSWRWFRERGVALRDEQGRPYRMAGSLEDITERKNAEAERAQLESQLRQSQKLEAMGTLAGGIAHDFNNILAAILGYGEMAQRDSADGTPQRRHIDAAMSAAVRAKSLVERILAFSRSGVGERVPVNVQSVVDEALVAIAASLPAGVRLERELTAGDAATLGDATQIHQVVMNLCANAVQAMRSSGTLSVCVQAVHLAEPRSVSTTQLPNGGYVRLEVRDTGTGIAPHVLERIFDPFFTTKAVGVGTGLGLSLVHGIVADLGGGIDVESHAGGSTFTVYLPWQGTVQPTEAQNEPLTGGSGETILLVDDEEALVRLGEEMMAELGYEPVGFASSTAALQSFRETPERFDVVLSDEAMPELTGSELAHEIRRIRPDIPIVLMSGYVTPVLAARARDLGIAEVLAKPLVARDIARSLASVLQD
jgi:PAS domain S-box-containing protein